jgi:iron complex transport system ATP-binding protein
VAYVPQRPVLPPAITVTDYVLLGRSPHHGLLGSETAVDRRAAAAAIDRLDLSRLSGRPLGSISGGEAQRAVLARALAQEAPVLAMDEPTASLDLGHAQAVLELADQLRRERGLTVLSALHDLTLAGQYAEELLLLAGGRPVASGPPDMVMTEANVRRVFGASVRVTDGPGGLTVAPVRPRR